jgi:cytochrome c-type biogenesis protein CcmH
VRHIFLMLACLLASTSWAIDPEPPLEDPILDAEYRVLINEVRCLVCQNQTIADSSAPLAADLRREIRRMLSEGATRTEVVDFLVARYGEFVMYRPRVIPMTWALWGAPVVFLLIGAGVFASIIRSRMGQTFAEEDSE